LPPGVYWSDTLPRGWHYLVDYLVDYLVHYLVHYLVDYLVACTT